MTRYLLACALWLAALVAPATAQGGGFGFEEPEAAFELYHRIDGDEVEIAIRTTVKRKWHVYHDELGQPDSVGAPTVITFESDSAYFYPVILPEPERADQAGLGKGGRDTWIWQHGGRFVIHGLGELDDPEAADEFEFTARVQGQVCDEGGVCIPFDETLESKGEGPDAVWADRPTLADFEAKDEAADAAAEAAAKGAAGTGGLFDEAPKQVDAKQLRVEVFLREDGNAVEAVVAFDMDEHWHIGHTTLRDDEVQAPAQATKLQLVGEGVSWGEVVFPEPYKIELGEGFPWFYAHEGRVLAYARGEKTGEVSGVAAWYAGQVCEDGGVCIEFSGVATPGGAGSDADFALAKQNGGGAVSGKGSVGGGSTKGGGSHDGSQGDDGLLQFILLAIGGGLFALVMPCTYPMIPITISFFTKQADARGGSVLPLSLAYGAGIILIFVLIGVVFGAPIIVFATHWLTNVIIGLAFLFFALALFGAINLQPPAFLMSAAGKASMKGGYAGVFLMGATLVVTSFTCTAPFVGSLLAASAASGDGTNLVRIALGMGVFGLTMAIPFFFLSLVPGRVSAMPKGGEWMNTIKVTLGFVEVAAALKFISNADIVLEWGVLSRELFLLLWAAIFVLTAAYLFGFIQIKGKRPEEVGAARSVFAIGFLLFGVYCWHGYTGHQMDNIMTALAPPYSSRLGGTGGAAANGGGAHGGATQWQIVVDDYEAAREQAIAQGKPLFINFTGHT